MMWIWLLKLLALVATVEISIRLISRYVRPERRGWTLVTVLTVAVVFLAWV